MCRHTLSARKFSKQPFQAAQFLFVPPGREVGMERETSCHERQGRPSLLYIPVLIMQETWSREGSSYLPEVTQQEEGEPKS